MGLLVFRAVAQIEAAASGLEGADPDERSNLTQASRVARQIVRTAAITAPPDLWLLRHVLGVFQELGLLARLGAGEAIYPASCQVTLDGEQRTLEAVELEADLHFLLARGVVEQYDDSFRLAGHPRVRRLVEEVRPLPPHVPVGVTRLWTRLFAGETLAADEQEGLLELTLSFARREETDQNHWIPTLEEIELGYRLLPIVLGLRANDLTAELQADRLLRPIELSAGHPACAAGALEVLTASGWLERSGSSYRVTAIGGRGFARGPGPFGIIETYHPYMANGRAILLGAREGVWVQRGENVGASQDANRGTFKRANDALDRFAQDTGFTYSVFVEHAIGRGEATRQRFERSGAEAMRYFGADLEDAAIDAAIAEQRKGRLPENMGFIRKADIGRPDVLVAALAEHGADPHGAVMVVGNGFHEVRGQTDDGMVEVFRGYQQAGILLLFTEENALSVDDLRATAWNTYHAGFKYVHEKSGQALRPAEPRDPVRLGRPLRAAWSECARQAGYVRADAYCSRTRTIYPYTPEGGRNPSISVNHFFVPGAIATRLGL